MKKILVMLPRKITIYDIKLISRVLFVIEANIISPKAKTVRLAINVKLFLKLFSLS
jgi:hypothetical protein